MGWREKEKEYIKNSFCYCTERWKTEKLDEYEQKLEEQDQSLMDITDNLGKSEKRIEILTKALEESENKIKKLICCGNCINQKCSKNFAWNYIAKDRNEMINIDKCTNEEYKFWTGG